MFGTALIVFREVLEAALIIGVIAAATRTIPGRSRWLVGGAMLGLVGAGLVAASMDAIANFADGVGQELFNASILGVAVLMLAWHSIWMASHGRAMAMEAKSIGAAISDGRKTLSVLLVVVAVAVLREGAETVLFLYGVSLSGKSGPLDMIVGGAIGVVGGAIVGVALYAGLLRIPVRWFFSATSALVLLLAAGMAAQAARFLVQADILPSLQTPLWDLSGVLPNDSALGTLLHGLVGYDASPAGIQVLFYVAAIMAIGFGMQWVKTQQSFAKQAASN
jgi:high-affinity iron transporter